jgi:hypothetical protein
LVNVLVVLLLGSLGLQWKADQDARLELFRADHEAKLELLKHDLGAAHLVLTLEDDPRARNVPRQASERSSVGESASVEVSGTALSAASPTPPDVVTTPATRSITVRLVNPGQGVEASGVRIDVQVTVQLQNVTPRTGQSHPVEISADRTRATVTLDQLAVGEDFIVDITATEIESSPDPLVATGMNARAVCHNCVGVAEL